jgi:chorismate dehydratase
VAETRAKTSAGGVRAGQRVSCDPWLALRQLRIGCVKYLNSRPLICAYDGPVVFEHPSILARMLAAGDLDVALVPTFEVLRSPVYQLVDEAAIACDGPVYSVVLAYRGELREIRSVALDPASLTSAHLVQVLLAEYYGCRPAFGETGEAQLIIGNQAIDFRLNDEVRGDWRVLDLGEEWKLRTGLPFVFAVWAMRQGIPPAAADALRRLKDTGVQQISALVRSETFATAEVRHRYLTEHIRFGIGAPGRQAVAKYRELLAKHALIAGTEPPLTFV